MEINSTFTDKIKKYVSNTGYLLLEKFLRLIVTLTIWALVIRYLGPEQFGLLSYALSFVLIFSILSDLGLNDIVVRELIINRQKEEEIMGSVFFLKFFSSLLTLILIFAITQIAPMDLYIKKLIFIMSIRILFQSLNYIDFYFQSHVMSKYTVFSQILSLISTSVLCLLCVYLRMPLIYFAYIIVIEATVVSIGLFTFLRIKRKEIFRWQVNFNIIKKLLKDSWPVILTGFAITIYMRIDQIMIKDMLDAASVGFYSSALRISEAFYFLPMVIATSLFPGIVRSQLDSKIVYENRLRLLFSLLFWLAIVMAIIITAISSPLVNIIYGAKFSPAAGVLSLHIWAGVFVFLAAVSGKWLIAENLQVYLMSYTIMGALVNISLNFMLIPTLGINGAAISAVFTQFFVTVFVHAFSKRTRPLFMLMLGSLNIFRNIKNLNQI